MTTQLNFRSHEVRAYASGLALDLNGQTSFLAYRDLRQFTSDGGEVSIWVPRRVARRLTMTRTTSSPARTLELTS